MIPFTQPEDALHALERAWPHIIGECRSVWGSELHYQAVIYHCLRVHGQVPATQIGMNVKMFVRNPVTALFKAYGARKHEKYAQGFEPIPDVVIFSPEVASDWRRRNNERTLRTMWLAIEVKASERHEGRLQPGEIIKDLRKLDAHRKEANFRKGQMTPVMLIVDTAKELRERMRPEALELCLEESRKLDVDFYYLSPTESLVYSTRSPEWPDEAMERIVKQATPQSAPISSV